MKKREPATKQPAIESDGTIVLFMRAGKVVGRAVSGINATTRRLYEVRAETIAGTHHQT